MLTLFLSFVLPFADDEVPSGVKQAGIARLSFNDDECFVKVTAAIHLLLSTDLIR
jgi:hypothetical protein